MEKVYILTIDDTNENWNTLETLVFRTLEKAKGHLKHLKINFLLETNLDEEESIMEDNETSFVWYYDGYYNENHYAITIEEKEIIE